MVYYGFSMNTNFLGGNLYLTFILGALAEIPASLIIYFIIDRVGRKLLVAGGFLTCAFVLLSNQLIEYIFGEGKSWIVFYEINHFSSAFNNKCDTIPFD